MTNKQYGEEKIKELDSQIVKVSEDLNQKNKIYSYVGGICGVVALLAMANPMIAIPMGGLAVSFFLNKGYFKKTLGATINRLEIEKANLTKSMQTGVNNQPEVQKKRKSLIDKLKANYSKQSEEFNNSASKMKLANTIAGITSVVACLYPSTILAIAALGTVGLKYLADNDVANKKQDIEAAAGKLNCVINDYNIGSCTKPQTTRTVPGTITQKKVGNTAGKTINKGNPNRNTTTNKPKSAMPFHVGGYSKEDEAAVAAYVRSLENQNQNTSGVQKRKI